MDAPKMSQGPGQATDVLEVPRCQHQWIIESPAGPSSDGVCRICGEHRVFQNYIDGPSWGSDVSPERPSGRSPYQTSRHVADDLGADEDE